MSGDERNQDIVEDDLKISKDTEASSFSESLSSKSPVGGAEEELPQGIVDGGGPGEESLADVAGGVSTEEKLLAGATGGANTAEESLAGATGGANTAEESLAGVNGGVSTEEELLAGATGGCKEASTGSGTIPKSKVVIGIKDLQEALLRNARNQISQFQGIKNELVETIKDLKELSRRNPGNWEVFERLRDHIKEANAFLQEINEAMTVRESREQYMNLQINQFFERQREQGENFIGTTFNLETVGDAGVAMQAASRSSSAEKGEDASAEESIDRSQFASAFVDQMMQAARFRSRMGEMDEAKEVEASVVMEAAGGAAEEPDMMEVAERANAFEDRDEEGRLLHPPVTGKYTLAIKAHQLYPESSSEDSPEQEPFQGAEGGAPLQLPQRNTGVVEDMQLEDNSQDKSSSDSANDENPDHYGL